MRSQFDQTNRAITRLENMLKCEGPAICNVLPQKPPMINHIVASSTLLQHLYQTTLHNSTQYRGFKTHRGASEPKNEPERSVLKNILCKLRYFTLYVFRINVIFPFALIVCSIAIEFQFTKSG